MPQVGSDAPIWRRSCSSPYVIEALPGAQCLDADERLDVMSLKPEAIRATATELLNAIAARGAGGRTALRARVPR
jgi:hypothetical protein